MRFSLYVIFSFWAWLLLLTGCGNSTKTDTSHISTDSAVIILGEQKFSQHCSACHNFKQDGIGPHLGGLTKKVSPSWIKDFIKDARGKMEAGDDRGMELSGRFQTPMPSFNFLTDDDLNGLLAYLHTWQDPELSQTNVDAQALKDPIPERIPLSGLVVELEEVAHIPPSDDRNPLTRITKLTYQPVSNKLFVVDLRGKLYFLNGSHAQVYLDMTKEKPTFIHAPGLATGFGSYAFHPQFMNNGLLYTAHTESPKSGNADFSYADSIGVTLQWVVSEWKTKSPGSSPFVGEGRELFRVNMVSAIHGVQEIAFNPLSKPGDDDYGLLYIGVGDGGSAENGYSFLCGSKEKIWGTVLRIDPKGNNSSNGHYGIPENNPFSKSENPNVVKEIFAMGFRNPHRIIWDHTGRLFISNIGHSHMEALYLIEAGSDSGWPFREGSFVIDRSPNMHHIYPLPDDDDKNNFTYPIAQYDHDEGNAIAGGFEYTGKALPELSGKFVFGDLVNGRLFYIEMNDINPGTQAPIKEWRVSIHGRITTLLKLCNSEKADQRFGCDADGELYLTTKPDGKIYKLVSGSQEN